VAVILDLSSRRRRSERIALPVPDPIPTPVPLPFRFEVTCSTGLRRCCLYSASVVFLQALTWVWFSVTPLSLPKSPSTKRVWPASSSQFASPAAPRSHSSDTPRCRPPCASSNHTRHTIAWYGKITRLSDMCVNARSVVDFRQLFMLTVPTDSLCPLFEQIVLQDSRPVFSTTDINHQIGEIQLTCLLLQPNEKTQNKIRVQQLA